ncbi:MAG TPA: hypothetical protein VME23_04800 [Terracidiphilus sp.]|nr:hypothetical protein [Terracidiphilus sp.]
MAHHALLQLSGGKGLGRLIYFQGLKYPILVKPAVYGNPLLSAQGLYFLEQMESVAHIRDEEELSYPELEYILDNYLFQFAKENPDTCMTFRAAEGTFWFEEPSSMYRSADHRFTDTLALDQLNDPTVLQIEALDPTDEIDFCDWDIGGNYARAVLTEYVEKISKLLQTKVNVKVMPSEERDGYFGKLKVVVPQERYIDFFQAIALEDIDPTPFGGSLSKVPTAISLQDSNTYGCETELTVETITATRMYAPILLSHFFSGVKETNPLKAYLAYYNVLEYYFEEALQLLSKPARTELEQLKCVLELLTSEVDIAAKLASIEPAERSAIAAPLNPSVGPAILGVDLSQTSLRDDLARWLYEIRCAVVRSKKTRRGAPASSFEPYSLAVNNMKTGITIVRWLAILCMEKDNELAQP